MMESTRETEEQKWTTTEFLSIAVVPEVGELENS